MRMAELRPCDGHLPKRHAPVTQRWWRWLTSSLQDEEGFHPGIRCVPPSETADSIRLDLVGRINKLYPGEEPSQLTTTNFGSGLL